MKFKTISTKFLDEFGVLNWNEELVRSESLYL
jgi:hypothetical protein